MQTGQIVIFLWMFNEISLSVGMDWEERSDSLFLKPVIAKTQKNSRKTSIMNRKIGIILSVICILCLTPLPRFNVTNARMIWKLYASIDTNKSYWNICWGKHNTVYLWIIRGHVSLPFTSLRVAGKKTAASATLLNLWTATRGSVQFCSVLWRDLNLRRKKTWQRLTLIFSGIKRNFLDS